MHKLVDEVVSDRFGLDVWVQNRLVERIFASSRDDQIELKESLAKKLKDKKDRVGDTLREEKA